MALNLAQMFAPTSPIVQWAANNQNFLSALGTGLMQGQNLQHGLQLAGQAIPQADALDLQQAEKRKADALAKSQANYTVKMFRDKGFNDLADMWEAGNQSPELLQEYFRRIQPQAAPDPWAGYKEAQNGDWLRMGDNGIEVAFDTPDKAPTPPVGYNWANSDYTAVVPIKNGPADKVASSSMFEGTDKELQALNVIYAPNPDPSSREYQAAWWILTQPKTTMVQTAQGMVPVTYTPTLPSNIRPPVYASQNSSTAAPFTPPSLSTSDQTSVLPQSGQPGMAVGSPLPGTAPKPNEQEQRLARLSTAISTDKVTLFGSGPNDPGLFDALSDPKSQLAATSIGGAQPGFFLTDAKYQQAANAISNIAQTYLYAMSGAAAPAAEVDRIVQSVTPRLGESPESVKAKKQRLLDYVRAIESQANGGVPTPLAPAATSSSPPNDQELQDLLNKY